MNGIFGKVRDRRGNIVVARPRIAGVLILASLLVAYPKYSI